MPNSAIPVRFWVEFPDPARTDDAVIYRCDLTWLVSRWRCIFGAGCPGIVAERPDDGCCTFGAHLTDAADRDRVAAAAAQLSAGSWQYYPDAAQRAVASAHGQPGWLARDPESGTDGQDGTDDGPATDPPPAPDRRSDGIEQTEPVGEPNASGGSDGEVGQTALVDGACIFLNRPGFPAGAGCALHQLAERTGRSIVETKPEVCWQLPIRRSYSEVTDLDEVTRQVVRIGEFDRATWGPGGHDLDWYCTREPEAHTAAMPLYLSARTELVALMGEPAYRELADLAESFLAGRASRHSPTAVRASRQDVPRPD
jgi:hypothetical protein